MPRLDVEPGVLHLDVDGVLAEDLAEPVELRGGVVLTALLERLADLPGETPESAISPWLWLWSSSQSTRGL
jgi:hypothetical protein